MARVRCRAVGCWGLVKDACRESKISNQLGSSVKAVKETMVCSRIAWLRLAAAWVLAAAGAQAQENSAGVVLTNAQRIAALGTNIPEGQVQARLQGVVTYVAGTSRVYLQDGDLAVQVNLAGSTTRHRVGARLEVTGSVLAGEPTLRLGNAKAVTLGE